MPNLYRIYRSHLYTRIV